MKLKLNLSRNIKMDLINIDEYIRTKPSDKNQKVTPQHTKRFHKKKHLIDDVILSQTEDHEIIHGEQAVKKQTPRYLHRPTVDFDIFTPTPLEDASETEKALDKRFDGDFFGVEPGNHPGTHRVVAHANKQSYADYTKPSGVVPSKRIDGKNYVTLGYIKQKSRSILEDPLSDYRHAKDLDTLNRVKIVEKKKKGGV